MRNIHLLQPVAAVGSGGLVTSKAVGGGAASQKLGKFKRSISATVLRPNKWSPDSAVGPSCVRTLGRWRAEASDADHDRTSGDMKKCKYYADNRREIITVRGQSYVSRLPKYWPPTPLSTRRDCPPSPTKAGVHTRRAERGVGGQYFGRRET